VTARDRLTSAIDRIDVETVRERLTRNRLRVVFLALIVLSSAMLVHGATTGLTTASEESVPEAPPTENHTVITESGRQGTITAYAPDGSVKYYNNSHTKYFDVDPVEGESMTVEYTATDTVHTSGPDCRSPPCAINYLERANLSTGEVEVLYKRYDHKETAGEWHDADRIDENRVVVADIVADQVFIVNTETEIVEWLWDAQSEFPVEGGGRYPGDWAHINDVEVLPDGRIMVSLRNQDQVVFIDRETGMEDDWTLGEENNYDIQYEQHNPDFIPESRGGPAVVVADSETGRVQEFQRVDGEWERTWQWADDQLQWPRDADRLPNGNTLIADSNGKRVIEVDPSGDVVWEVPMTLPYDAERLETGDESAGGQSARALGLESRTAEETAENDGGIDVLGTIDGYVEEVVPHRVYNAIVFVSPAWMSQPHFAAAGVALLTGLLWIGAELKWRLRAVGVGFRPPVYRRNE
jgi:hypothetical protein